MVSGHDADSAAAANFPDRLDHDLRRFTELRSDSPHEVQQLLAARLMPHRMEVGDQGLDCLAQIVSLGSIDVVRLRYGGRVRITAPPLHDRCLVSIPLAGTASYHQAGHTTRQTTSTMIVLDPRAGFTLDLTRHYDQLLLRIDRELVETVRASLGSSALPGSLADEPPPQARAAVVPVLEMLTANHQLLDSVCRSAQLALHVEWLLVSALWGMTPRRAGSTDVAHPHQGALARAEEFVHEHLADPISVTDLAAAAGISERTLFAVFSDLKGCSPMSWVRTQRLERVHAELTAATSGAATVTAVAMRWGFGHLGEFAKQYARAFGESPSATLRAAGIRHRPALER